MWFRHMWLCWCPHTTIVQVLSGTSFCNDVLQLWWGVSCMHNLVLILFAAATCNSAWFMVHAQGGALRVVTVCCRLVGAIS